MQAPMTGINTLSMAACGDLFWYDNLGGPIPVGQAVVGGVVYAATSDGLLAFRSVAGE